MVEKKPVSIGWQVVFVIIPYVWIYAFYRIEKLTIGIVLAIISTVAGISFQMILPFPWGLGTSWIFYIIIPIYFVVKWSREWNEKYQTT